jgi:autotransporter-associated beta strand protein
MVSNRKLRRLSVAASAAAAAMVMNGLGGQTLAATDTWTGNGSANWSDSTSWTGGNAIPLSGDLLVFAGSNQPNPNDDLAAGLLISGITFNSGATSFNLGPSSNSITFGPALDTGLGNFVASSITNNSANAETISLAMSLSTGNRAITTAASSGQLNFSGTVTRGANSTVQFTKSGGNINVTGSGLTLSNGILGGWATIGLGTNAGDWATLDGSNNVVAYGAYTGKTGGSNMTLSNAGGDAAHNIKVTSRSSTANSLNGSTTGTYDINTLAWNIGNSNPGGDQTINISNGQILRFGANGAIMNVHSGSRTLNVGNATTGTITAGGPSGGSGELSLISVPFSNNSQRLQINAPINDNTSGAVSVNVLGDVVLKQASNFSGGLYVMADSRAQANSPNAFGTGTVTVLPGGSVFALSSGNTGTFPNNFNLSGTGSTDHDSITLRGQMGTTLSGTITLTTTAVLSSNSTTNNGVTYSGPITGPGGLTLAGGFAAGSVHLDESSPNTYVGDTTIDAAGFGNNTNHDITLWIDNASHNNIMSNGAGVGNLVLRSNANLAQFDVGGSTQTVNGLISSGTAVGNTLVTSNPGGGTIIVGGNNESATFGGTVGTLNGNGTANIGVTKIGTGTQILSGTNNYTGNTAVNAGTLVLSTSTIGNLTVGAGLGSASIAVGAPAGSIGTVNVNNLTFTTGGDYQVDVAAGNVSDAINASGVVTFNDTATISPSAAAVPGTYTIINSPNNAIAYNVNPIVNAPNNTRDSFSLAENTNSLVLTVTGFVANLKWTGSADGTTWDVASTANWNDGAGHNTFFNSDNVTFDDTAAANHTNVTLNTAVEPGSVTVSSNTNNYTIGGSGSIGGSGALTKGGSSTLTLSTANTYAGGTILDAGEIAVNNASAIGAGTLTINGGALDNTTAAGIMLSTNNAQNWNGDFTFVGTQSLNLGTGGVTLGANRIVTVNGSTLTVGGAISDGGNGYGLTKAGAGSLVLGSVNTYSGNTTVNAGILNLAVGGGTGAVRGTLNINAGATAVLSAVNALGFNVTSPTTKVDVVNINGGTLDATASGDQGWGVAYTLTGGTMQTNGGVSSASSNSKFAFGGPAGANTSVTTLASATSSVIAGHVDLRNDNGANTGTPVVFNVADGPAAIDLLVSAAITRHDTTANQSAAGISLTGSGVMSFTGANTYTGPTNVNGGTLNLGSSGALGGGGNIIFGGGTLQYSAANTTDYAAKIVNSSAPITIDTNGQNVIYNTTLPASNGAGLTKLGAGRLSLSGGSGYSGATTINGGTLAYINTGTVNNSITVNNTATLAGPTTGLVTVNGDLFFGTNSTDTGALNVFNIGASPSLSIANSITLNGPAAGVAINVGGAAPAALGTYPLVSYGSTIAGTGTSGFALGTLPPRVTGHLDFVTAPNTIDLVVTGLDFPVWSGALSSEWSTNTLAAPKNWVLHSNAATTTDYLEGDNVLFDDTATGTTTVDVSVANVSPGSVAFNNAGKSYTITGSKSIAGSGALTKSGAGSLTITNANTYSGGTTLNAGTLVLNNAASIGTGPLTINGGTLDTSTGSALTLTTNNAQRWAGSFGFAGSNNLSMGTGAVTLNANPTLTVSAGTLTVGGAISSGTGNSFTKAGAGTLVLTANSSYNGGATVTGGTLQVSGSGGSTALGSGNVTVNAGAMLIGANGDSFGFTGGSSPASIIIAGGTVTDLATSNYRITLPDMHFINGGTLTSAAGNAGDSNGNYSFFAGTIESDSATSTAVISAGKIALQNGTVTFTVAAGNVTGGATPGVDLLVTPILSNWNGAGTIVKAGAGVMEMTGVSTYTTGTQVNAGSLILGSGGSIASAPVSVAAGAAMTVQNGASIAATTALQADGTYNDSNATRTIATLNGAATGAVNLNSTALTITGGGSFDGVIADGTSPGSLTVAGGTLALGGANTYTGNTTVNNGATLNVPGSLAGTNAVLANGPVNFGTPVSTATFTQALSSLTIGPGVTSSVTISHDASIPKTLQAATLTFNNIASSKLDLTDNILISTGLPTDAETLIADGNQRVFTSTPGLVLGYKDAGSGNFEIRATLLGDTDLDGKVNVADLANLAGNFGKTSGQLWINGDFDYNGNVNVADLADLAGNFGNQLGIEAAGGSSASAAPAAAAVASAAASSAAAAVPEPASILTMGLLAPTALLTSRRIRRRRSSPANLQQNVR